MDEYQLSRLGQVIDYKELSVTHIPSSDPANHKPYWKVELILLGSHDSITAASDTMATAFDNLLEKIANAD